MKIFPAIDLKENKCVRLTKGDDNTSFVYNERPVEDVIPDNLQIFPHGMVNPTVANMEEYNALKSSGRMELIKNERLVKALHDYYTKVAWVKSADELAEKYVFGEFIPFMSNYSNDFVTDSSKNIYDNSYAVFHLINNPPKDKLSYHAGVINTASTLNHSIYVNLVKRVSEIRRMIRKELKQ